MKINEEIKLTVAAEERFRYLAEQWFLSEPAFFAVYCSHRLTMNPNMACAIRTGKGRIEYNPKIIDSLGDNALEEMVGIEMIRLFLKHPYERRPEHCPGSKMLAASDMTIWSNYRLSYCIITSPDSAGLPEGQSYEWYLTHLPAGGDRQASQDLESGATGADSQMELDSSITEDNGSPDDSGEDSGEEPTDSGSHQIQWEGVSDGENVNPEHGTAYIGVAEVLM